jgi:hypothetical protein
MADSASVGKEQRKPYQNPVYTTVVSTGILVGLFPFPEPVYDPG